MTPLDILRVLQGVVLICGLVIVYFGFKSYSKTKSRSMLLLAVGFAFVSIGTALAGILFELFAFDLVIAEIAQTSSGVIGFIMIVYSIVGMRD